MKILVGMPAPDSWGGPIASEPPFVDALRALGHDVTTEVYVYGDKEKATPFFSRVLRVLRTALRFRRSIRSNEFDIIHLNTSFDRKTLLRDSFSLFVMRPGRAKVFMKLHGSLAEQFFEAGFIEHRLIDSVKRRVDGFGFLSVEELENFERLGFETSKFFRVKNVVAMQGLNESMRRQKENDDTFELLFVSRFVPTKGLVRTIEACDELRRRGRRFRLTCVGDGESRRDAEDAVGRFGLGRVVTFTGYIREENVTELFLKSDIFIFPSSHPEGFPIALFKAVAAGLPIVTTRIRAAADYLSEPQNCFFCEPEPKSIADRLAELINDKAGRERMSSENLDLGRSFAADRTAQEYVDVYERILKK